MIASGPTVPDPTTYADALAVLARYDLRHEYPQMYLHTWKRESAAICPKLPKMAIHCLAA